MPALRFFIPFLIMFRASTMGLCRLVMLRGDSQVCFVRGFVVFIRHIFSLRVPSGYSVEAHRPSSRVAVDAPCPPID